MAEKQTIVRSVSFNLADPDDDAANIHAGKYANFSAYVRRLILLDKLGGQLRVLLDGVSISQPTIAQASEKVPEPVNESVVSNSAEGFL